MSKKLSIIMHQRPALFFIVKNGTCIERTGDGFLKISHDNGLDFIKMENIEQFSLRDYIDEE